MPCCPRLIRRRWNFEPYSSLPKMLGICSLRIPGPLSCTPTLKRFSAVCWTWIQTSGRMPASSQASRALSTASLMVVSRALRGLSKPSRWRFLAKNSLTEMSRWLAAIDCAVARRRGGSWPLAWPLVSTWPFDSSADSASGSSAGSAAVEVRFLLTRRGAFEGWGRRRETGTPKRMVTAPAHRAGGVDCSDFAVPVPGGLAADAARGARFSQAAYKDLPSAATAAE